MARWLRHQPHGIGSAGASSEAELQAASITSPLDGAVVPGDTASITLLAAGAEAGLTAGVWRSATTDYADAAEVEGYTALTGVDGTATITDVPKA